MNPRVLTKCIAISTVGLYWAMALTGAIAQKGPIVDVGGGSQGVRMSRDKRRDGSSNDPTDRYRVIRNGHYYLTDGQGADLLRAAVIEGYRRGYVEGNLDRESGRHSDCSGSEIYRRAEFGYRDVVERKEYKYYFREGFERGYGDGFNGHFEYGYNNGGTLNMHTSEIGKILLVAAY